MLEYCIVGYFCGGKIFMDFMVHTSIQYYSFIWLILNFHVHTKSKMEHVLSFKDYKEKTCGYRRL